MSHTTKPIFKKLDLTKYRKIIAEYWRDYDETLADPNADERVVECIKKLKTLEIWESNLFILLLHCKKPSVVAEKLDVKVSSLNTAINKIKRKLRC